MDETIRERLRTTPGIKGVPKIEKSEKRCVNCKYYRTDQRRCYFIGGTIAYKVWWSICTDFRSIYCTE